MAKNLLLLNAPNLDLPGKRQPEVYGAKTLRAAPAGIASASIEMRIPSIRQRETARHFSSVTGAAKGVISGPGGQGKRPAVVDTPTQI
jgi:3-dehydroquinate dehydratase